MKIKPLLIYAVFCIREMITLYKKKKINVIPEVGKWQLLQGRGMGVSRDGGVNTFSRQNE
jgi:hypothetical protein